MKKCSCCAEEVQNDAKKCKHCGEWLEKNDEQSKVKQTDNQAKNNPQKPEGFRGWLIGFVSIIFIAPIGAFSVINSDIVLLAYGGLGRFINIIIILMYVWLAYLLIKRSKTFKKWYLGIGTSHIILLGLFVLVNSEKYPRAPEQLSFIADYIVRLFIYVAMVSLYLWNSKRVKNTFIN